MLRVYEQGVALMKSSTHELTPPSISWPDLKERNSGLQVKIKFRHTHMCECGHDVVCEHGQRERERESGVQGKLFIDWRASPWAKFALYPFRCYRCGLPANGAYCRRCTLILTTSVLDTELSNSGKKE